MMRVSFFITLSCVGLLLGCGKGTDQAKEVQPKAQPKTEVKKQSEPSPPNNPPANPTAPKDNAKTPQPVKNADENQTAQFASDKSFLQSLRPLHEGKPSTLKIELEKIRAQGEPVTLKELDAWYKAVPREKNPALAFMQTTNAVTKNGEELWEAVRDEKKRNAGDFPVRIPAMRAKVRAYLVAHQELSDQLFAIAQRYPANQPARFPYDATRGMKTLLPHVSHLRKATAFLKWRSEFFASQPSPPVVPGQPSPAAGYQQQAVSSILVLLRIVHLQDGEPFIISTLVQVVLAEYGREALETLLNMRTLNDLQLVSLQQAFASFNWPRQFATSLVGERATYLGVEKIIRTGTREQVQWIDPSDNLFDRPFIRNKFKMRGMQIKYHLRFRTETERNLDMTTLINMMNKLIEVIRKGYPEAATQDEKDSPAQANRDRFSQLIDSKKFNKAYCYTSIHFSPLSGVGRMHKATASQQFATAALAIERYRLANQWRIPKTLQELIPNYLSAHPFDPYTGKPLTYIPNANGAYELRAEKSKDAPVRFKVNPATRLK